MLLSATRTEQFKTDQNVCICPDLLAILAQHKINVQSSHNEIYSGPSLANCLGPALVRTSEIIHFEWTVVWFKIAMNII